MKFVLAFIVFTLLATHNAQAVEPTPETSIHHYDCRVAHLPTAGEPKELFFQISPQSSGHEGEDFILTDGTDEIIASANSQMIGVSWTRKGLIVANAQAWVQKATPAVTTDGSSGVATNNAMNGAKNGSVIAK